MLSSFKLLPEPGYLPIALTTCHPTEKYALNKLNCVVLCAPTIAFCCAPLHCSALWLKFVLVSLNEEEMHIIKNCMCTLYHIQYRKTPTSFSDSVSLHPYCLAKVTE